MAGLKFVRKYVSAKTYRANINRNELHDYIGSKTYCLFTYPIDFILPKLI